MLGSVRAKLTLPMKPSCDRPMLRNASTSVPAGNKKNKMVWLLLHARTQPHQILCEIAKTIHFWKGAKDDEKRDGGITYGQT